MPRLLDLAELRRQLADVPGLRPGAAGSIVLAVRAPTFADALRLVEQVGADAEAMDHHPDIDLRYRTVTFTLSTHSAGGVTQLDVELAHQIAAAARAVGAEFLPPPQRVEIGLDVVDADAVRPFWAAALGYRGQLPQESENVELQDPAGRGPVLWFQHMDPPRTERGRFHLDVYLPADEVPVRLQRCLEAGGRLVTDAHAPSWWVLADPEGNEACLCAV